MISAGLKLEHSTFLTIIPMRLPTISVAIYFLLDVSDGTFSHEHDQHIFKARSDQDWASVWHEETHIRCRESLIRHLYWACEKDIYKVAKREEQTIKRVPKKFLPILEISDATSLLRVRRSPTGSITDECCSQQGCTWEEYAEYCPDHRRLRNIRTQ